MLTGEIRWQRTEGNGSLIHHRGGFGGTEEQAWMDAMKVIQAQAPARIVVDCADLQELTSPGIALWIASYLHCRDHNIEFRLVQVGGQPRQSLTSSKLLLALTGEGV